MTFSYKKLWVLLAERGMVKKDLKAMTGMTSSTIAKLGKGQPVSMEVLGRICEHLQVNIADIVDYIPQKTEETTTGGMR